MKKYLLGLVSVFLFAFYLSVNASEIEMIDINTADAATLSEHMIGIGDKKAADIISYRQEHGPFLSINDLLNIKGIGDKTLEKNKEHIFVTDDDR